MLRKKPKYYIDFMKKTTNNDFLVSLIQNIGKIFGYCRNFAYLPKFDSSSCIMMIYIALHEIECSYIFYGVIFLTFN